MKSKEKSTRKAISESEEEMKGEAWRWRGIWRKMAKRYDMAAAMAAWRHHRVNGGIN
jgi:hypothetical protein